MPKTCRARKRSIVCPGVVVYPWLLNKRPNWTNGDRNRSLREDRVQDRGLLLVAGPTNEFLDPSVMNLELIFLMFQQAGEGLFGAFDV